MQRTEGNYSTACKLADMRVIDLKRELKKRGMKKEGVKHFLVEQLSKALQDEGNNPEEYLFAVPAEGELGDSDSNSNYQESLDKEDTEKGDIGDGGDVLEANDFVEDVSEDSLHLSVREEDILSEEEENADSLANDDIQSDDIQSDIQSDVDDDLEFSLCRKTSFLRSQDVNVNKPIEETVKNSITDHCNEPAETSEVVFADVENEEFDGIVKETDCKNVEANEESNDCDFELEDTEEEKPQDEDATVNPSSGTSDISTIAFKSTCLCKNTAVINAEAPGRDEKNALKPELQNTTNLWVRGIAPGTSAFELKSLFSKHSKVVCAKIVRNASKSGACFRGFVTVATAQEASKCISNLHCTILNGRIILVERTRYQPGVTLKAAQQPKTALAPKKVRQKQGINAEEKISEETTDEAIKAMDKEEEKAERDELLQENEAEQGNETQIRKDKKDKRKEKQTFKSKSTEMDRDRTEELGNVSRKRNYRSRRQGHQKGSKPFHLQSRQQKIRPNSTKQRFAKSRFYPEMKPNVEDAFSGFQNTKGKQRSWRRPERELRKNENESVQEISRRFIERIQRDEPNRLDRERKRLRIERTKLQRKRTEILRLVREREILERECTEWKRELQGNDELRQIEETQRTMKRHFPYGLENESYQEYRKRASLSGLHHQFDEKTKPSDRHHLFERQREWYNKRENSLEVTARGFDEVQCRVYAGQIPPSYDNNRSNRVPKRPERNNRSRSREAVAHARTHDKRLW